MAKVKIIRAGLAGCSCASILVDSPYFSQIANKIIEKENYANND